MSIITVVQSLQKISELYCNNIPGVIREVFPSGKIRESKAVWSVDVEILDLQRADDKYNYLQENVKLSQLPIVNNIPNLKCLNVTVLIKIEKILGSYMSTARCKEFHKENKKVVLLKVENDEGMFEKLAKRKSVETQTEALCSNCRK